MQMKRNARVQRRRQRRIIRCNCILCVRLSVCVRACALIFTEKGEREKRNRRWKCGFQACDVLSLQALPVRPNGSHGFFISEA